MAKANAALPRFIKEFNQRFHREPVCRNDAAFAPLSADFDLDTLLAARYNRKTDACGCFSFQNYIFQVDSPKPPVKKNIVFLFSEKIGFKVYYDKRYYDVKFPEFLNKGKKLTCRRLPNALFTIPFSPASKPRNLPSELGVIFSLVIDSRNPQFRQLFYFIITQLLFQSFVAN
jgi:hypothetical protein